VRGSNTEPIIRLSAEAPSEEEVQTIRDSVFESIRELISKTH
jgi:phosphomannomutase